MRARTYAREGRLLVFSQFYFPFFNLHFSVSFIPPPLRSKKRAVVSLKTTRCFSQNDTSFFIKQAVVSHKTSRRLQTSKIVCPDKAGKSPPISPNNMLIFLLWGG